MALASLLLLVVLVPSAMVLETSGSVLSLNKEKVVAANLASGQLEIDRGAADSPSSSWGGTDDAPTLPLPTSPVHVPADGESYYLTQTSGWCVESTMNGTTTWTSYSTLPDPPPPTAYTVTVTVKWLAGSQSLSASEVLTTPPGVNPASPSTGSCP